MIPQLEIFLRENIQSWGLPEAKRWSVLVHNNYHPHYSCMLLLWFADSDRFPRAVTKMLRAPEVPHREFANLQHANSRAAQWVPRPVSVEHHGPFWALWMEGVPGLPVRGEARFRPRVLHAMIDTLASIHSCLRCPPNTQDEGRYGRLLTQPLRTLAAFGNSPRVMAGCETLAREIPKDWIRSLPVIPQHGDLFHDNLLNYRDQWHVVDFEGFGQVDLPFYDLLTLILSLFGEAAPQQWNPALLDQVPRMIARYARFLGMQTEDVRFFLPLTLVNWFHVQWTDGRKAFATRMYQVIEHYFEHTDTWQKVFISARF